MTLWTSCRFITMFSPHGTTMGSQTTASGPRPEVAGGHPEIPAAKKTPITARATASGLRLEAAGSCPSEIPTHKNNTYRSYKDVAAQKSSGPNPAIINIAATKKTAAKPTAPTKKTAAKQRAPTKTSTINPADWPLAGPDWPRDSPFKEPDTAVSWHEELYGVPDNSTKPKTTADG